MYVQQLFCTADTTYVCMYHVALDPCDLSPCMNGASCNDSVFEYSCTCQIGFTGDNCEVNLDDCRSNSCENDGTCLVSLEFEFTATAKQVHAIMIY